MYPLKVSCLTATSDKLGTSEEIVYVAITMG